LPQPVEQQLDLLVRERSGALKQHRGLSPTRTVLLTGPPGVGKTLVATDLAHKLDLPLATLDLGSLMSSHLGRSARNLQSAFAWTNVNGCVLFVDEFDAIAGSRGSTDDVGEARRLVNVLLLELERWRGPGIVLAATNHPELLDRAVLRRFDLRVDLPVPGESERKRLLRELNKQTQEITNWELDDALAEALVALTPGYTGSDLRRLVLAALRRSLLGSSSMPEELLTCVLEEHPEKWSGMNRDRLWLLLHERLALTQRQIATRFGVSHVTVGNALRRLNTQRAEHTSPG
jgi:SpoVK/Ycf46/Vps4 family AAA+-type ATPase